MQPGKLQSKKIEDCQDRKGVETSPRTLLAHLFPKSRGGGGNWNSDGRQDPTVSPNVRTKLWRVWLARGSLGRNVAVRRDPNSGEFQAVPERDRGDPFKLSASCPELISPRGEMTSRIRGRSSKHSANLYAYKPIPEVDSRRV